MRRIATIVLATFALSSAWGVSASWAPPKYNWPPQFDVGFGLSDPTANVTNQTCHLYYDWPTQTQMIDYTEQCLPGTGVDTPCKLIFDPAGIWLTTKDDYCCLLHPDIGIARIDFLTPFNYSNNETATDWAGNTFECYHWLGLSEFEYWTTPNQHDITLLDGGTIYWRYGPFNVRPQNSSDFVVPQMCESTCSKPKDARSLRQRGRTMKHLKRVRNMFSARGL